MKHSRILLASALAVLAVIGALGFGTGSINNHTILAGFFFPADTAAKPKNAIIRFNEEVHEFGKIEQNSLAETTFIIYNDGTDTLVVDPGDRVAVVKRCVNLAAAAHLISDDPHESVLRCRVPRV